MFHTYIAIVCGLQVSQDLIKKVLDEFEMEP
jgi:hypothetical protein